MSRSLPPRPNLDHLKNEAKALLKTLRAQHPDVKLTDAQRQLAREYGFPNWAELRAKVLSWSTDAGKPTVNRVLTAIQNQDLDAAMEILKAHPGALSNIHVAAALTSLASVIEALAAHPELVNEPGGDPGASPLLYACFTPRLKNPEWQIVQEQIVRVLLEAGADPNARGGRYGVPALYGVTGMHNAPGIARLLLEAGANPTDGESVFHAAERFHEEALELLWEFGVKLNFVGEWGNTPLYFLLRWYDMAKDHQAAKGLDWLLSKGADPNVACGPERENSLHVAVRRGQPLATIQRLLDHGADVDLRRADRATAWLLARRAGYVEIAELLERSGARREALSPADELLSACGRGDAELAAKLSSPTLVASLEPSERLMLNEAASAGRGPVVSACIAAGFDVNQINDRGATALHEAAINGYSEIVRSLLRAGADHRVKDPHHQSTAMGWAQFGADFVQDPEGRYEDTVRALLTAGAEVRGDEHVAAHEGVRAVIEGTRD